MHTPPIITRGIEIGSLPDAHRTQTCLFGAWFGWRWKAAGIPDAPMFRQRSRTGPLRWQAVNRAVEEHLRTERWDWLLAET